MQILCWQGMMSAHSKEYEAVRKMKVEAKVVKALDADDYFNLEEIYAEQCQGVCGTCRCGDNDNQYCDCLDSEGCCGCCGEDD